MIDRLRIEGDDAGQRLDRFLRKLLPGVPLGAIFRRLRRGDVRVDGRRADPSLRLVEGMVVELRGPVAGRPAEPRGGTLAGPAPRIVFEDEHLLIVDKPAGLRVQPGTGDRGASLVSWLASRPRRERAAWTFNPAPAHRIDRGASGLVVIGLSAAGLRGMAAAFHDGSVTKTYLAVVEGLPAVRRGAIDARLRDVERPRPDGPKAVVDDAGRAAHTEYEVVAEHNRRALLRIRISTGRQHQIRAHLAWLGHPIVGDRRYGSTARVPGGFLLHAAELWFEHPVLGRRIAAVAEPPAGFRFDA